jgi:hypothetical protein
MMLNKVGFEAVVANGTFYFLCKHLNRESFRHSLCVWLLVVGAGPLGVVTAAVTVAVLGLTTAALRNGLLPSTPQKVCTKCDGYGVQQCHVCEGQGKLIWEGKLRRMDPCPLCFGSCLEKCRRCGGIKMKRGIPPNLQTQTSQNVKKS